VTLVAVLLGAVTAGGTALANQVSPGGGVLADNDDFEPAMLVLTTAPTVQDDSDLTGHVAGGGHQGRRTTSSATGTTTPAPTTTTTARTTTTAQDTTTSDTVDQAPASQGSQVFTLVNQQRKQAGCAALKEDSRLDKAAQGHSTDMATQHYFDHTTPSGVTFDKRETAAGYPSPGGENIAMGQTSAQQVMTDWMNSSGHRANILNCQFTAIGIGLDTNGWYWTQDFGY
jgi:uncharacterized protein YkwD